ncbi:noggin [Aplysia californica]|uniref:Noggin n=1 Tax=Aplysia californica TaxID=6500 RepID=A0ABM1A2D9_APLCA|nr:noggin [Aplysia californica]
MLIMPVLLLLLLKLCACQSAGAQAAELSFRSLQTDGQLTDDDAALYFPLDGSKKNIRRPLPSDSLPIEDLVEDQNSIYDPRDEDMNVKMLRKQLGKNYDKKYMSIYNPKKRMNTDTPLISFVQGRPKGKRPHFLRRLRTARLQDGRKIKLNASKRDRRKFQKYMWSLTFCPVKHSWKYLGIRFWPQWIKEGTCTSKRSCSVPEGMTCKPSASTNKTFLRWHCADFEGRESCKWIPILYPIITECSCSC